MKSEITYRIRDWDRIYENNRSRALQELNWVPIPNKMNGLGYLMMCREPDGASLLGSWIALVQIASTRKVRGTFTRDDGRPMTVDQLVILSHFSRENIMRCLEYFSSPEMRWLETLDETGQVIDTELAVSQPSRSGTPVPSTDYRKKGKKGRERSTIAHPRPSAEAIEKIYLSYPRLVGKRMAIRAIENAVMRGNSLEKLERKTRAFAAAVANNDKQFVPYPATWFNQDRFEDDENEWTRNNGSREIGKRNRPGCSEEHNVKEV